MYISSLILKWCKKETFLELSYEYVNVFSVLRSIASGTIDINLRSCVLNRHKLQQSQIATIQESLPSQFVICRNLWSRPWRHKLSPITLKACYGYLREYPDSLLTWIWKVAYLPVLVLFQWYICLCVCISAIKPMLDVPRKPSWKGPILNVNMFSALREYTLGYYEIYLRSCVLNRHKLRESQIATPPSQFVMCRILLSKPVTAQTESNNTENVFCVLGRVPMFTFDMNMKTYIFAHSGVISPVYMFLCISDTIPINDATKENALKWSDVYVNVFSVLGSTSSGTIDINLSSCVLNRHKLRQSQIATNQDSLPSQFVICSNLWSRRWRHKLCPITPKT